MKYIKLTAVTDRPEIKYSFLVNLGAVRYIYKYERHTYDHSTTPPKLAGVRVGARLVFLDGDEFDCEESVAEVEALMENLK